VQRSYSLIALANSNRILYVMNGHRDKCLRSNFLYIYVIDYCAGDNETQAKERCSKGYQYRRYFGNIDIVSYRHQPWWSLISTHL